MLPAQTLSPRESGGGCLANPLLRAISCEGLPVIWRMNPNRRHKADQQNYGRPRQRAARQDPQRDSIDIWIHATGRGAVIDGPDAESAKKKRQKRGHGFSPL